MKANLIFWRNSWYATYYKDGKRVRKSMGKDKNTAQFNFDQLFTVTEEAISFKDAVDTYFLVRKELPNVWDDGILERSNNKSGLGYLKALYEFGSITYVNEVDTAMLNKFIKYLRLNTGKKGYSRGNKTINRYLTYFRSFFKFCMGMQWISHNPADKSILPNLKETTPEPYYFTSLDYEKISKNGGKYKSFYTFLYETGVRPTDTYFLSKKDFCMVGDKMYIDIKTRKTSKQLRVPISKVAQEIVEKASNRLFPWTDSARARQDASYQLKRCFGARGVGVRYCKKNNVCLHSFRHTFAMRKLADSVPMEIIGQLLGHSFTRMTELYARYVPDDNVERYV
tara:strand:+ start:406 stop:1422 length:1017 start_codon:yes stop_codon:yes gene_type:complete